MKNKKPALSAGKLETHFTELRQRLFRGIISLVIAFVICWFFSEEILDFFRKPIQPFLKNTAGGLVFTAPMDQFLAHISISFFSALFVSSPYWLLQLWAFIAPGLYRNEKKTFLFFWCTGAGLFLLGACFSYLVVFPFVCRILLSFGSGMDQPMITIKNYLSFLMQMIIVFGFIFELPLVLLFLNRLGLMSVETLRKYRRQAIVLFAGLSALISPPDILSMFLLLIPLVIFYEISVMVLIFSQKRSKIK